MFIHNINPTLLNIGPFEIRYYGLVYVIGFILIYYFLMKKRKELNLEQKDIENAVLYLILGVIIGARLFQFIWNPSYYISNPLEIFKVWKGGMSLHGGVAGVFVVGYFFCKKHKISFGKIADIVVLPALFALALGRIANFINGELVGTVTNVSWCFKFPSYEGCRHPTQLYGAAGRFILLGALVWMDKLKEWKDGFLFWNFIFWMGLGRLIIDFLREDPRIWGLSTGQYLSLVLVIIGGYVLWKYYKKDLYKLFGK